MRILLLRGQVPKDRPSQEICHKSIDEEDDIYSIMASRLGDEHCEILYEGGKRTVQYSEKCFVRWIPSFRDYKPYREPDVIWARGGFPFYKPILKQFPTATKIFYGAGKRYIPKDNIKYDLVLADSIEQQAKIREHGFKSELWTKPAAPQFKPIDKQKVYDICFVAAIPEDERKNVKWVYETCPQELTVLQLGYEPRKMKVPKNFRVRRLQRHDVPRAMSKCRVGIAPYLKADSAPRAMVEMIACGLPVVCLDTVRTTIDATTASKEAFWDRVMVEIDNWNTNTPRDWRKYYDRKLSMDVAVECLRRLINGNELQECQGDTTPA